MSASTQGSHNADAGLRGSSNDREEMDSKKRCHLTYLTVREHSSADLI